jgi:hypothetical protein
VKQYPTIPHWKQAPLGRPCVAFDKLDGSNIRAEWSQKRGWSKFGSRQHLIDASDLQLGYAVTLFEQLFAEELARRFSARVWKKLGVRSFIVFLEYVGPSSFAGNHWDPPELMDLVLLDVNPTPRDFLPPKEFLAEFGDLNIPAVVYEGNFNRELVEQVRTGTVNGHLLSEGIVAKGKHGKELWMAKAKTDAWIMRLRGEKGIGAVNEEFSGRIPEELATLLA